MKRRAPKRSSRRRWSGEVTRHSDAMDLEPGVFKKASSRGIAESLKHSAEGSSRRKSAPYASAMSMLNFYINRGGRNLPAKQKGVLKKAKGELKEVFKRGRS